MITAGPAFAVESPPTPITEIFVEDFSKGLTQWWSEGGEAIWVQDNYLHMKADALDDEGSYVATTWLNRTLPADVRITIEAQVISSSVDANNINVFLHYSDPERVPLYDTRHARQSAAYPLYHQLNGYIFTFVRNPDEGSGATPDEQPRARIRIRRCPGFELLAEANAYRNVAGEEYEVEIVKRGSKLSFSVDGQKILQTEDANPHESGLLGLRTYRTYLRWGKITVIPLERLD